MTSIRAPLGSISYEPHFDSAMHRSSDVLSQSFSSLCSVKEDETLSADSFSVRTGSESAITPSLGGRSSSISTVALSTSFFVEEMTVESGKAISKILKSWKEHIELRFHTFKNMKKDGMSEEEIASFTDKVKSDLSFKEDYVELVQRTRMAIDEIKLQPLSSRYIRVLSFKSEPKAIAEIRAIASLKIDMEKSEIYVNSLLIAPENLPMNSPSIFEGHVPEKGSGTLMLHSLCVTAQRLHLHCVRLKPLANSVEAYKKLGMTYVEKDDEFFYPIEEASLPKALCDRVSQLTWSSIL